MTYDSTPPANYRPFALVTRGLILVPTPDLLSNRVYRDMYASLHADDRFCSMAFGHHFPAREWDEQQRYDVVKKEVDRNWAVRGMGDMGVGLWSGEREGQGRLLEGSEDGWPEVRLIEGEQLEKVVEQGLWEQIEWIGYAGVREARLPEPEDGEAPRPSWEEFVEVRYGISPSHWGKGLAPEAARAVIRWAETETPTRRFIAEIEQSNARSGTVLERLGFERTEESFWKEPDELCYTRNVAGRS